ncbi:MAG: hypothetical protein Q7T71_14060 [Herbiconiux sp.]|nr:hypothetical protein [Herbiconiux sp.]
MTIALIILALLAFAAVVASVVTVARDGYRRVPTRPCGVLPDPKG